MDFLSFRRRWRRRKYRRMSGAETGRQKKLQIVQFGGKRKRVWRIRSIPKLRLGLLSPLKLWKKFSNGYSNMMFKFGGKVGGMDGGNTFAGKRIPGGRKVAVPYSKSEFQNRLVCEIYKSMVVAAELNSR